MGLTLKNIFLALAVACALLAGAFVLISQQGQIGQLVDKVLPQPATPVEWVENRCGDDPACIKSQAAAYPDAKVCDLLTNDLDKVACGTTVTTTTAVNERNLASCLELTAVPARQRCMNEVIFNTAVLENNPALCENIADTNLRTDCQISLQNVEK